MVRGSCSLKRDVINFTVEVLPEAGREFRDAFLWYFERSPIAAEAFRSEIFECIDGLGERADMWPSSDEGIHFHVLCRFPYTVWYDLNKHCATVIAIAHQHRRPDYWKTRG